MPKTALLSRNGRTRNGLLLGLVCGALGVALHLGPWGAALEEDLGLGWLFRLRGPVTPPDDVVVVSIDKRSSARLGLPYDTAEWPRRLHAELLDSLHRAGPRVVVFDLWFRRERPAEDRQLAAAMRRAGNVLVLEHLSKCGEIDPAGGPAADLDPCRDPLDERSTGAHTIAVHQLRPPNPAITAAAAGSAPFTLPDLPRRVTQFWTFDQNAGGMPSLPTLALVLAARPELEARLLDTGRPEGEPQGALRRIRRTLAEGAWSETAIALAEELANGDPALLARLEPEAGGNGRLTALARALAPPTSRYLNLYGPPLSLTTLSYADVLHRLRAGDSELAPRLRDKAVFIGLSSPVQWQQMDEFTTVFSDPHSGHDLSGIELLATAYANLGQGVSLAPLSTAELLVGLFAWGLFVAALARLVPPAIGLPLVLAAGAALLAAAVALFARQQLWLPLAVPLLIQLPAAVLGAVGLHYLDARRDRRRIHALFRHYLPEAVVDRLVREGGSPLEDRETVFGVTLHADAENYTGLAETLPSDELTQYMNRYYEALFEPIRARGGSVSDVVGDELLAIWASRGDDREIRAQACRAALDMLEAMEAFGRREGRPLRSRIGIHCGALTLAHVGAHDHYEFRAVGDIVNTSSRLEELNKERGTRVLVSAEVVEGLEDFDVRQLGGVRLRGKAAAIEVCELLGHAKGRSEALQSASTSA